MLQQCLHLGLFWENLLEDLLMAMTFLDCCLLVMDRGYIMLAFQCGYYEWSYINACGYCEGIVNCVLILWFSCHSLLFWYKPGWSGACLESRGCGKRLSIGVSYITGFHLEYCLGGGGGGQLRNLNFKGGGMMVKDVTVSQMRYGGSGYASICVCRVSYTILSIWRRGITKFGVDVEGCIAYNQG